MRDINEVIEEREQLVTVCNAVNTGDHVPEGYDSCLDYWQEKSDLRLPNSCPARSDDHPRAHGFSNDNCVVGAHVIDLTNPDAPQVFITPICKSCNSKKERLPNFSVKRKYLVPIPLKDSEFILSMKENQEQIKTYLQRI